MCGRLFQSLPLFRLMQIAKSSKCSNQEGHSVSYNVCPTTHIPVMKANKFYFQEKDAAAIDDAQLDKQDAKQLAFMKWGHQSQHNMVINGRIEQMLNKRMFVNIIENRCVVIMEGYFQWNQKKEPFSLRPKEEDHFLVAGLYTEDNQIIILTKDATPELSAIHHRMPVILSHEEVNIWMNPRNTKDIQNIINKSLLRKDKQVWKNVGFAKVAPHVSSIKQKSVKCLMTFDQYKKQLDRNGLMRFWKKAPAVEAVEAVNTVKRAGSILPNETIKKSEDVIENLSENGVQQKNKVLMEKLQPSKLNKQPVEFKSGQIEEKQEKVKAQMAQSI